MWLRSESDPVRLWKGMASSGTARCWYCWREQGRDAVVHRARSDRGGQRGWDEAYWGPHWPALWQGADALWATFPASSSAFHADAVCRWLPGRWQLVLQVIELSSGSQNKIIALLLHTNEKCVTQLFRHRRSLFYACFGSGHCCKKKNKSENLGQRSLLHR